MISATGGLAAAWQAGIGNVAAGSLFAQLQAIAMGAAVSPGFMIVGGIVVGVVTGLSIWGIWKLFKHIQKRRAQ